ncbi:MAG: hypothetical protein IT431_12815 [Phycisphaerales bacterium]|nr:hypothetical protein [Phycisphaerales bacterium]
MRAITMTVLASTVLMVASAGAGAQAIVETSTFRAESYVFYDDLGGNRFGPRNYSEATITQDIDATATSAVSQDGFVGRASGSIVGGYSPNTPGFVDPFHTIRADMACDASIDEFNVTDHLREVSHGAGYIELWFSLAQETDWSFEADFAGASSAGAYRSVASVFFQLATQDFSEYFGYFDAYSLDGVGDFGFHGSVSGTLQPGAYYMVVGGGCTVENTLGLGGAGSTSASVTNAVFTVPSLGALPILALVGLGASARRR